MFKQLKLKVFTVGMALVLPAAGWGDVNFSQKPLAAGGGVDPNLMFMLDDSGSMRWGFMPDGLMGGRYLGSCNTTVNYGSDAFCSLNVGSRPYLLSSRFNKVYYNPDIAYTPPKKSDGSSMPNAEFADALLNGYDSGSASMNLSSSYRAIMDDYYYYGRSGNSYVYGFTVSPYASATSAFYYRWRDGCGDASDINCYQRVTISGDVQKQNFANWFSYYRTREMAAKAGIGGVFGSPDLGTDFRLGWGRINRDNENNVDGADVRAVINGVRPFESSRSGFLQWLYSSSATGSTPLRRALEGAGRYYEYSDRPWLDDPDNPKSTSNPARECRISATMLMTDGYYSGNNPAEDVAGAASKDGEVITNGTGDSGQYKAESPFSDGNTNSRTLADVAAYYWKRDLQTDIDNYVPTIADVVDENDSGIRETIGDPAFWQHMMTYGIGLGVEGTVSRNDAVSAVLDGSTINWWGGDSKEDKINDLLRASMVGRGDFFSASDPETFRVQLDELLAQFLGNAGSATGLDFNVASIEADDALVFSSYFDPSGWTGDLEAITLSPGDDGRPEAAEGSENEGWSARAKLETKTPDERVILTYNGGQGQPFRWNSLSTAQQSDLNTGATGLGSKRLEYLRGKRRATLESENAGDGKYFRQRQKLLGTIVNSTPRYVGEPDSFWPNDSNFGDGKYSVFRNSNVDRTPVVYVGANDGMLHGFKATPESEGGGDEVLAYVPSFVSSTESDEGLHYLTEPGFDHRFYVDLNLEVVDVHTSGRRDNGNVANKAEWRTVLIGGSRAGAKGIFALDVTNPDEFSEDSAAKHVLWEFTHEDLGYLVEPPEIAQMEWPDGKIRWTVFVPSGYNSGSTGFFMLDLEAGLDGSWDNGDYRYVEFESGGTGLSPLTLIDNVNDDHLVDRVYAGDLDGNMWVAYNDEGTMKKAYSQPYFKANQPITSAPAVALSMDTGKDPDLMILFGTGKYLEAGDSSSTDDNYFYAVHETSDAGSLPITASSLVDMPLTAGSGTIDGVNRNIRIASGNRVDYDNKRGWYTKLPSSGERVVNYPIIRGEYVYVNTLIPGANPCLGGGDGWVMGFEILRAENKVPGFAAFEDSTENASGFKVSDRPSQLSVWGNLLAFNSGSGGAEFIGLPELIVGLGRKGWREITE
ncbi:MAG: pilus assembly protein [Marinobacter sp.]